MLTPYYTCITLVHMNSTATTLEQMIYKFTHAPSAPELQPAEPTFEARCTRARESAQDRFDALGLPRGLASVRAVA